MSQPKHPRYSFPDHRTRFCTLYYNEHLHVRAAGRKNAVWYRKYIRYYQGSV